MKKLAFATFLWLFPMLWVKAQVVYDLNYDANTATYTVSIQSGTAYTGGLARISNSTQVTIVAPHTTGGFLITNLTNLQGGTTQLDWGMTRLDAPTESSNKDYLFFSPTNAVSYTPFDIDANSSIDLFSFQSASGCLGEVILFDNTTDPLLSNNTLNPSHNFVVIGSGFANQYTGNLNAIADCVEDELTYCLTYDNNTQTYTVSMQANQDYMGGLARLTASTQVSIVAPHTTGGFQITNLTDLQGGATPLDWGFNRVDAPVENATKDYLFFKPTNTISYSPFDIQKDSIIDLFSFQSGSGCLGDISLFDNDTDALNNNVTLNPKNNMVIIGGGLNNLYAGNTCPIATCSASEVNYCIRYDNNNQTYTVSMQANQDYTGGLARLTASTQVSIVTPHTTGGFQITNLTDLQGGTTPLDWGFNRVDAPVENATKDYLFFKPTNTISYSPFDIQKDSIIDLFSFQSGSGCLGDISLFDNDVDPLNNNMTLNPDNNVVIIGGGLTNQYTGNTCPTASCQDSEISYCISFDSLTQTYTVSMQANQDYTGGLARLTASSQVSIVVPHTTGGFQITNLTDLQGGTTPLDWGFNRVDAPVENATKDYLFFNPTNTISYSPFDIQKDSIIDLFSFQSGSGCLGDISLFDNGTDALNNNVTLNPKNNMVIIGGGLNNLYAGNTCPIATCNMGNFKVRVLLQGALLGNTDTLMRDDLRKANLIPLSQPYTDSLNTNGFKHVMSGNELTNATVLSTKSDTSQSIVDWVFLEIRDATDTTTILQTTAALVQRDGYVVDASTGIFPEITNLPDSFFLAIKHRNHLGVMTAAPLVPVNGRICADFTNMTDAELYHYGNYNSLEMATINGKKALWAGNALFDTRTKYDGQGNDRLKIGAEVLLNPSNTEGVLNFGLADGYYFGDINMDGKVKYDGQGNDRLWLQNIILTYPLNYNGERLNNYNLMLEQLP